MATRRNQYQPSTYLSFDGAANSYVDLNTTAVVPDATAAISLSCWAFLGPPASGSTDKIRTIIGNRRDSVTQGWTFKISNKAADQVEFTFFDQNTSSQGEISTLGVSSYRWVHGGYTFDGQTSKFYIDGNLNQKSTLGVAKTISRYTGQNIRIGHRQAAGSTFETFAGSMSDLCIWNRVVTTAEFLAMYNNRVTPTDSMLARWRMTDGSGSTVTDSIGGYDGTITGGVTWGTAALNTNRATSSGRGNAVNRLTASSRNAV